MAEKKLKLKKEIPSFILSEYIAVVQIDLEGSGIESWDDVEDHYIKWGKLHATLKDGRSVVIEGTFDETDYKWGEKAFVYDDDYNSSGASVLLFTFPCANFYAHSCTTITLGLCCKVQPKTLHPT